MSGCNSVIRRRRPPTHLALIVEYGTPARLNRIKSLPEENIVKRHPASTYPQQLCKIELYDTLQSTSGQRGNVQNPNETPEYQDLIRQLRGFVDQRDWSQFHSPKNLAMALTGEVGELVEHFQWLSSKASDALDADTRHEVRRELADVQIYLMLLADRLDVDLMQAVADKIEENTLKYPAHRARGRSDKYDKL